MVQSLISGVCCEMSCGAEEAAEVFHGQVSDHAPKEVFIGSARDSLIPWFCFCI